ncbi:MAG: AAA family ATPase [Limnohabitans sp.]|uniref:AAA family ATPase n=1 Tax=Limnohabitans sp. TaxID=1907725 RepID=UPI003BAE1F6D
MLDTELARHALFSIPPDLPRDEWVKASMGAHAAGLDFETFNDWSAQGGNYDPAAARDTWRSIKPGKGIGPGTLFKIAAAHGWRLPGRGERPAPAPAPAKRAAKPAPESRQTVNTAELWSRCEPAPAAHPYIVAKAADGVPLGGLRVVPDGDPLRIAGESMAGALVVPVLRADGSPSSLQFITPPATADRLKAKGKPGKLNLPGATLDGWFTVGELAQGGAVYLCEGIGQAWACWQATGRAAVVCFGWGRVRAVADALRQRDPSARLVVVPDVGKEREAQDIARDAGALLVLMPEGWPRNADVNDYAQREGFDALESLLFAAVEPARAESRFKLLTSGDLAELPPLRWLVRGVLPSQGLAGLYGPSASGKSFLALDLCAAVAEGRPWFGNRTQAAPVVYCALEGEGGIRLRAQAWEMHKGRKLPDSLRFVLQPFKLTEAQDVQDLANVVLDVAGTSGGLNIGQIRDDIRADFNAIYPAMSGTGMRPKNTPTYDDFTRQWLRQYNIPDAEYYGTNRNVEQGKRVQTPTAGKESPRLKDAATATTEAQAPIPAPDRPKERKVGALYDTPKGLMRWSGSGWVPVK